MFKTKGFSANNSLKRRAVIVDAPDLAPEEIEFFITGAGIADTDKIELPQDSKLDFDSETLYEDEVSQHDQNFNQNSDTGASLVQVKGIGKGTVEHLNVNGIHTVSELLRADPEELSAKISGASSNTVLDWQKNAKALINS